MKSLWAHRRKTLVAALTLAFASLLLLVGLFSSQQGPAQATSQTLPPAVPGEIIVGFEEGVSQAERDDALGDVGALEEEEIEKIDAELVKVDPDEVDEAIKELEADPRVEYAEPNFLLFADDHPGPPNDPSFHELWGLHNFGQTVNGATGVPDADIDALEAWGLTTGSASVVVGVIDTGVDFGHPDLGGSMETSAVMWINPGENCVSSDPTISCDQRTDGVDNDGNTYVDDFRGWDFVNNDNNPFDDNGHGTHVAGTIGAIGNNGEGVLGVNWTVKIMALKFLSAGGSGTTANAVKAVNYAAAKGAHITNNSWGGGGFSQALLDAILTADAAGSLFVAAAGNSNVNTDTSPHYPSSYNAPNVIAVAATTSSDAKASFSNYGKKSVDLGAPGTNILSTTPGNTYSYFNGTSMATPHVAGAAALVKAAFPTASDLGIKALLFRSVDPNSSLNGRVATDGRLNVNNAVQCASAPKVWIDSPPPGFVASTGEPLTVKVMGANCASASGVTVSASASVNGTTSAISLTARGDGLYTGTYTPTTAGTLTISATATVGAATDTRTVSGQAVQNYRFEDATFNWIDATAGGTNTGINSDDTSKTVSLPFPFTFYGQSFSSVKISSNGYVVFGSSAATAYSNVAIPNTSTPNGLVAPFWDDLNPASGGSIWYKTVGTAPNRRFVVAWVGVPHYPNVGNATLEVILEEGTNDIRFQYSDVNLGNASYNYGASATIGVENLAGTIGKQFSYNQAVLGTYENAKAIRFTTAPAGVTITTASLADGTVGQAYSQTLQASGGTTPYTWSIAAGTLPPGLSLSSSGTISGTPTTAGTASFTVQVADSSTPPLTSTKALSIAVGTAVTITTTNIPNGQVNVAYNQILQASGGTTPYTWSVTAGSLPPGLSLASNGTISGTPTSAGPFSFTAQVTDSANPARTASQPLSITVVPAPLTITTASLPNGTVGQTYSQTMQASGGTTPYTWSLAAGSLPPSLGLASNGIISGAPTSAGTYTFTVQVADSAAQTATKALSITVDATPPVEPPSNLQAIVDEGRVELTWTASPTPGATYTVYRADVSGGSCGAFSSIATGITATSYVNESVSPGTYCYQVTTVAGASESAPSNTAEVVVAAGGD